MSLKVKYLDGRQLKGLRIDLHFIASKELLATLDDYIGGELTGVTTSELKKYMNLKVKGNYLCNIFNDEQMRELEYIKQNYRTQSL